MCPSMPSGTIEQRLDCAVVDVVRDRLSVDGLRHGFPDQLLLAGLELEVEAHIADLGAVALDHLDAVGARRSSNSVGVRLR